MLKQPEFRKSKRFIRKSIIKLEDDLTLSPHFAVSHNLSGSGMCFKSIFEFFPGARILLRIEDYTPKKNPLPAKVVWCNELKDQSTFCYEVGIEFLKPIDHAGSKEPLPL